MVSTSNTPQIDQEQSFLYFRVCIGGVCFVFLFVLIIGRMLFERQIAPLDAISDYYYSSSMHNVFVGGLCILAALLICYRYEQIDTVANFFAGICAIGVALFPEAPPSWYLKQHCEHLTKLEMQQCEQVTNLDKVIGYVHWAFAAFFLVTIALIVLGLFTRPHQKLPGPAKGSKHPKKYIRNRWYRWLGGLMFLCVIFCFICQVVILPHFTGAEGIKPIFCLELISLILFIAAWVIKGQALLWDDAQRSTMAGIFQYIGVSVHDAWKSFRGVFPTREQQASEAADFLASLADFIVSTKKEFTPPLQADSTSTDQNQQREILVKRVINTAQALREAAEKREGDIGGLGKALTGFVAAIEKEFMPPQTDSPPGSLQELHTNPAHPSERAENPAADQAS